MPSPIESHILDVPSPIDDLRLMCGKQVQAAHKGDTVAAHTAMATCIACLRAYTLKLEVKIQRLEMVIAQQDEKKVDAVPVAPENAEPAQLEV